MACTFIYYWPIPIHSHRTLCIVFYALCCFSSLGTMISPLARGSFLLVALISTTFSTMLMADGALPDMYGVAFVPIYLFELVILLDVFTPPRVGSSDDLAVYRAHTPDDRSTRCVGMFNFVIWLVISILLPLWLSGINTVPASSIGALFILWLCIVFLAQHKARSVRLLKPFSLRGMASALSRDAPTKNFDFDDVLAEVTTHEHAEGEDPSEFEDQRGTTRGISVRDSLRSSPPPSEHDLEILEDADNDDDSDHKMASRNSVQIDREGSEREAADLETMASGSHVLAVEIMK